MKIFCKNKDMLDSAVMVWEQLDVQGAYDDKHTLTIKRLPPKHDLKGYIEWPQITIDDGIDYEICVKMDEERYTTLAHEMVHLKQLIERGETCEKEAYFLEKSLTMTPQK